MDERDQQGEHPGSGVRDGGDTRSLPAQQPLDDWREQTTPELTPVRGGAVADPSVGAEHGWGGPAYAPPAPGYGPPSPATAPPWSSRPVAVRRGESTGGLLLVLAGVAGGVSLLLPWVRGNTRHGQDILQTALSTAAHDRGAFLAQGWWQPVLIVLGGALLFVLGFLLFVPARSHRALGVLALLVALGATAAVLVPMAQDGWSPGTYDLGWWFAAAVAALGLLGALKAALTGPRPH